MSGFKYKTTDLNDMIGLVSIGTNPSLSQYIMDSNTFTQFTQYYIPLRNDSGPPGQVNNYIGRLYNNALYTTSPILQDIKNSVIARYNDFEQPVSGSNINSFRPSWANSCSVIIIGGGGGGAAGQQGFQKQGNQSKSPQDGKGGGAGGAAGMVSSYDIQLASTDQIIIDVAAGGAAGVFAGNNNSTDGLPGGSSVIYFKAGGSTQLSITALGGQNGFTGSSNGQAPGAGGLGGWWTVTGPFPQQTLPYRGKDGQAGGGSGDNRKFVNGGNVSLDSSAGNILPYQIISNGGGNQFQGQVGENLTTFVAVQGYGAGGTGGAAGNSNGPGPLGSQASPGGNGFVRIYWLNKA
jgi:hypothetical protein